MYSSDHAAILAPQPLRPRERLANDHAAGFCEGQPRRVTLARSPTDCAERAVETVRVATRMPEPV